jgi:4-carboxymuconolactone decarboxylase
MSGARLLIIAGMLTVAACASEEAAAPLSEPPPSTQTAAPQGPPAGSVVAEADIPPDIQPDSWARLPRLKQEAMDAAGQRAWAIVVNPKSRYAGGATGPVGMWLYSPRMAEHIFPASTYLRFETDKDQRLTELTILATAREVKSQYEWSSHEPAALKAGLEPEIIDIVRSRRSLEGATAPGLGDRERTIIQFAREAVSEPKVSSTTFQKAIDLFGNKGVMDLAGLIGYYSFVNITLKSFDVQLAPGRTRLLPPLW